MKYSVFRKMGGHIFTDSLRLMGQVLAKRREKVMENTERSVNVYSCSSVSSTRQAVTNNRGKVPSPPTSDIPMPWAHQLQLPLPRATCMPLPSPWDPQVG